MVFLFGFVISMFIGISYVKSRQIDPIKVQESSLSGKPIPKTILRELITNKDFSEFIQKENVIVIFLASNCDACKKELNFISKATEKGLVKSNIVGIMFEGEQTIKDYIDKNEIKFPILIDKESKLMTDLDIDSFPTNLRIKSGFIDNAMLGFTNDEKVLLSFFQDN
jgi:peroxiredoxin